MTDRAAPQYGSHLADAIYAHDCERVRELLADGDDPNRVDRWGMSLLIKASMGGDLDIVEALLDAGAELGYEDVACQRRTALTVARSPDVLQALLARGPEQRIMSAASRNFTWNRAGWGAEIINAVMSAENRAVHERGIELYRAAQSWDYGVVAEIAADGPAGTIDAYGGMVLTRGAEHGIDIFVPLFELLAGAGADIDGGDFPSPLLRAANRNDVAMVQLLLGYGADPNVPDPNGATPLACSAGWYESREDRRSPPKSFHKKADAVMEALIEAGADVNATCGDGTVLMCATGWMPRNVKRLLEAGADPTWANSSGWTPLHVCRIVTTAKLLRKYGGDIHARTNAEETPLHIAAKWAHTPMVRWLWRFKATRDARTRYGRTALEEARNMMEVTSYQKERYLDIIELMEREG